MNIYVIQVIALVAFCLLRGKKTARGFLVILLGAVLLLRTTSIGTDLSRYNTHFITCGNMSLQEITNTFGYDCIGFYYTLRLLYLITSGNYQAFLVIYGLMTFVPIAAFIKKMSVNPIYSLLCYVCLGYYTFQFSGLKQALAFAILCYAFTAVMEKKPIRFYLLVILAVLYHLPALIFLPAYIVGNMKWNRNKAMLYILFFAVIILNRKEIATYLAEQYETVVDLSSDLRIGGKVLVIAGVAALGIRYCDKKSVYSAALLQFMIIAASLQTLSVFGNVFERLSDYYFFFSIIYIPFIIRSIGGEVEIYPGDRKNPLLFYLYEEPKAKSFTTLFSFGMILLMVAYFSVFVYNTPALNPYRTWLF